MHNLFLWILLLSLVSHGLNCPFGWFVSVVLAVSFPSSFLPIISLLTFGNVWGRVEREHQGSASTAQQYPKVWCLRDSVPATTTKHCMGC